MPDKKDIKEAIMAQKAGREEHEIAGCKVWIYGLSAYQMEQWRQMRQSEKADAFLSSAKLVQLAMRDEQGERIFEDNELTQLAGRPNQLLEPVVEKALKLSGYGADAQEAILKNLHKTLGDDGLFALLASIGARCPNCSKDIPPTSSQSST